MIALNDGIRDAVFVRRMHRTAFKTDSILFNVFDSSTDHRLIAFIFYSIRFA